MESLPDFNRSRGPGSSPGRVHHVVFLVKLTVSDILQAGVQMGTNKLSGKTINSAGIRSRFHSCLSFGFLLGREM